MKVRPAATVVIANPVAAGGAVGRRWKAICASIRGILGPVDIQRTVAPGHATALAREAVWAGRELVLSLGGDGTHSEVVAGIVKDRPGPEAVTLGVLPAGTGGDFRRMLVGSNRIEDHARRILDAEPDAIDVGLVRVRGQEGGDLERTFLNEVSVGTSGLVCAYVNRSRKRLGGSATYFLQAVRAATQYVPLPMKVTVDGQVAGEWVATTIMVGNGRYSGGGMRFTPDARLADGMLDVTVLPHRSLLHTWSSAPHLYAGTVARSGVGHTFRGHHIEIACPVLRPVQDPIVEADGDPIGTLPLAVTVIVQGVRMLGVRPEVL